MKKKKETKSRSRPKHYLTAPPKSRFSYFLVSFVLSLALLGSLASVLVVDKNSRMVGWSEQRVELAFSNTAKSLEITVAGHSLAVDKKPVYLIGSFLGKLQTVYNYAKPAPDRLADMLYTAARKKLIQEAKNIRFS